MKDFSSKIGIPVTSARSNLEGIEVLLSVAEAAPKDLLSLRCINIERQDFAGVAIRAEDAFKSVTFKATTVAAKLHLDTLPSNDELVRFVKVFRRGNSFFNFLKLDWRQAKAAFNSCIKETGKYDAAAMEQHFSEALAWKAAETEFAANDQFKTTLGNLFDGVKTDFEKIRRLHAWHHNSAPLLLTSDFSFVNLSSLPEQHLVQLSTNAIRVRGWIGRLHQLLKIVAALPGLDPALPHVRRIEDLFVPLSDCEQWLKRGATVLRQLVVPTASAKRAGDLVELKRRVSAHTDLLISLIAAPKALCLVAGGIGLPTSTLSYQDLSKAVASVESRSRLVLEVSESITKNIGANHSLASSLEILSDVVTVEGAARSFLCPLGIYQSNTVSGLLSARLEQTQAVMALIDYLASNAKPGSPTRELIGATLSALDSFTFMSTVMRDKSFVKTFGPYLLGLSTNQASIELSLYWAGSVKAFANKLPPGATKALLGVNAKSVAAKAVPLIQRANIELASYMDEMASMGHWGKLDWMAWGGSPMPVVVKLVVAFILVSQAAFSVLSDSFLGAVVGFRCTSSM